MRNKNGYQISVIGALDLAVSQTVSKIVVGILLFFVYNQFINNHSAYNEHAYVQCTVKREKSGSGNLSEGCFFLEEICNAIIESLSNFGWKDIIDILLLSVIIYWLLKLTSKTRAIQVLKGLGIILVAAWVADLLDLAGTYWILQYVLNVGALLLVIIFQPELRRALARLGRGGIELGPSTVNNAAENVEEILKAVLSLSKKRVGALIVFERKTGLRDVIESGTRLDARISSELIENLFFINSPLHDERSHHLRRPHRGGGLLFALKREQTDRPGSGYAPSRGAGRIRGVRQRNVCHF